MIKLGVNPALFRDSTFEEACNAIAAAGYDSVEIFAIAGLCEHLKADSWRDQKEYIKYCLRSSGMTILSCEAATQDVGRLKNIFEAATELEIPIVNIGPGGESDNPESLKQAIDTLHHSG